MCSVLVRCSSCIRSVACGAGRLVGCHVPSKFFFKKKVGVCSQRAGLVRECTDTENFAACGTHFFRASREVCCVFGCVLACGAHFFRAVPRARFVVCFRCVRSRRRTSAQLSLKNSALIHISRCWFFLQVGCVGPVFWDVLGPRGYKRVGAIRELQAKDRTSRAAIASKVLLK